MSEHKKIVNNFIHLLKTSPSLFSQEDRDELSELIDKTPDDIKSLSNVICEWLKKHPDVDNALVELEKTTDFRFLVITHKIPDYQTDKQTLKNALHEGKDNTSNDNQNTEKDEG